jgi:cytochrome c-type biogenesis protein CcmH/NrfG
MILNKTKRKQLITIIFIASFVGTTAMGVIQVFNSTPVPDAPTISQESEQEALKAQVQGYETVLKREPSNRTALEGLVAARLQLKDFKGAIAPLEKLVKLYPDRADYVKQLAEVKQQYSNQN